MPEENSGALALQQSPQDALERIFMEQISKIAPTPTYNCAIGFLLTIDEEYVTIVILPVEDVTPLRIKICELPVCDVIEQYRRSLLFGKEYHMVKHDDEIYLSSCQSVDNYSFLTSKLRRVFPVDLFGFKVDFSQLTPDKIRRILNCEMFIRTKELVIAGDTIETDLVNKILDTISPDIFCVETPLQLDFPHARTLKMDTLIYENAQNLKIEALLGDFQCSKLIIKNSSFDCRDMNKFLSHLVNLGFRNLTVAKIAIKKGLRFEKQQLFKGIATMRLAHERHSYLLSSEVFDGTPRQFKLAKLQFEPSTNTLTFTEWTSNRFIMVKKIMIILRQKEDLKAQLRNNIRISNKLHLYKMPSDAKDGEWDPAVSWEVLWNEKKMLQEHMNELIGELSVRPVYLSADGFYQLMY